MKWAAAAGKLPFPRIVGCSGGSAAAFDAFLCSDKSRLLTQYI